MLMRYEMNIYYLIVFIAFPWYPYECPTFLYRSGQFTYVGTKENMANPGIGIKGSPFSPGAELQA